MAKKNIESQASKVVQTQGEEVAPQILATAIVRLDETAKKFFAAGLTETAIVILLHESSKVGKPAIRQVLRSMKTLRKDYCTK